MYKLDNGQIAHRNLKAVLMSLDALLQGIDSGIQAHLAWNQKLLRCALLRKTPGDDMMRPQAHLHCQFGQWFVRERAHLAEFDSGLVADIDGAHTRMHDAVRAMCTAVLEGRGADPEALAAYEDNQSAMISGLVELRHRVVQFAMREDPLTGLPLRHGLENLFDLRCKDAHRSGDHLYLAMIDIDRFKSVNDTFGHPVGDEALKHVAQCLRGALRDSDTLVRWGGEEFLVMLLCSDGEGASVLAERLLRKVRQTPLDLDRGPTLHLSVTVGLAGVCEGDDMAHAIYKADQALLQGKAQGRDRLVRCPCVK